MKNFYLLLSATLLVFLAACINPQKLVKKAKYEKALKVSSRQLRKGKVRSHQLDAFEKSFAELNRQDSLKVSNMRATGQPSIWPSIYDKALQIDERQRKVLLIVNRLKDINIQPYLNFYPADDLLEEATDKSALYYYAYAQEFLGRARKGNRQDARQAFELIKKCRFYRSNFKDAPLLEEEMYELGTTNILIDQISAKGDTPLHSQLFSQLIGRQEFPYRRGWQVLHLNSETVEQADYRVEVYFYDLNVSHNNESSSDCCNSEEVEDGCKVTTLWNATDSVWVEVREVIYKTVSVQVTTYEQSKSANLKMHFSLIDTETNQELKSTFFQSKEHWSNTYSDVTGDDRALYSGCEDEGGSYRNFPSGGSLLKRAACDLRPYFYQVLQKDAD